MFSSLSYLENVHFQSHFLGYVLAVWPGMVFAFAQPSGTSSFHITSHMACILACQGVARRGRFPEAHPELGWRRRRTCPTRREPVHRVHRSCRRSKTANGSLSLWRSQSCDSSSGRYRKEKKPCCKISSLPSAFHAAQWLIKHFPRHIKAKTNTRRFCRTNYTWFSTNL